MKIGELAKRTGLNASRIRFYEAEGLIAKVERQANGYRHYPPETQSTLEIITSAQRAGFTLDQIRHLLPLGAHGWQHDELLSALRERVSEIDALQKQLAKSKSQLLVAIATIEDKPEGLNCSDNAKRVLDMLSLSQSVAGRAQ